GPSTRQITLDMYREGLSIEEIAERRTLKASTIESHLAELLEAGEEIDIERLVPPNRYEIILNAFTQVGDGALKPIKEFLGDEYSYGELRLVRSAMRRPV
ncbi:MAG TPA: helix-turn-helix domain-containing protein, partial [Ktedonobacteraceae bacterium]|nr:helix-turn-helix domain-containing protein [Ktedonobacteraceae bacterium]